MDIIALVDHLPVPGETVGNGKLARAHGGKGANQAVAAAKLGGRVTMRDFYDAGEVNRIIISERDAGNNEIGKRTIKHFRNGRQPVMVEANAVETVVGDL